MELVAANEAYRLVGESVAGTAEVDLAMTHGAGWPVGPFALAGQRGLRTLVADLTAHARDAGTDAVALDRFRVAPLLWQMATM
jgi:3-hydroxyacyl-CoA dehydrogenase